MKCKIRRICFSSIGVFVVLGAIAQPISKQSFFSYPLSIKPKLNANFGEMRPNHFHMGLDLSTESQENLPVYAPANGHISRMKIESGGFGRAIYIDHPNGTTTLYAHMNKFIPAAEVYLKENQYAQETWKIDLHVPSALLPVKKGQLIGYSGNTGASQGPHVHYEIRDTETENCLNPLLFKFPLTDITPPDLYRIAFYDRDYSVYEQQPLLVGLVKRGGRYVTDKIVELPYDRAFLAIQAIDRITGFSNPNGIYSATLKLDGETVSSFKLDNIGYDKTRYLNGHIDYMAKSKGGAYYQMIFPPKEFGLDIYTIPQGKKYIELGDAPSSYSLSVADANENIAIAEFQVRRKPGTSSSTRKEGVLMTAGQLNIYEDPNLQFVFHEDAFYDDVHFQVLSFYAKSNAELSSIYQTLPEYIPVHSRFTIRIKPNRIGPMINSDRVVLKRTYKTKTEIKKAIEEKGFFAAEFRDMGFFQLLEDLEPPIISASLANGAFVSAGTRIVIDATDNNKTIDQFIGRVDGQWVMFQPFGNRFVYTVDEHFPSGEHKLSVLVKDVAGNSSNREWKITRR
jgi:hypothetical protein